MTLSLLLPIGLAALAALLLPLLIHLARRSEQRLVSFAALRWLQAKPQPRRKRRFEEHLLMVLRLLLLAALALLLAEPVLLGKPDRRPWILVAPGVDATAARRACDTRAAQWHWLAPGFPALDAKAANPPIAAASAPATFASLLREADAKLPAGAPLTVLVPAVLDGADAEQPMLSRRVDWRVMPASTAPVQVATGKAAVQRLMVRYAPERSPSLRYLRAAGAAWQAAAPAAPRTDPASASASPVSIAPATQALDGGTRHLVWLVPGALPPAVRDWISAGGDALLDARTAVPELADAAVVWRDGSGPLARGTRLGRGRVMRLERDLLPAQMPGLLEPDFPAQLQHLFATPPPAPARVDASAYAPRTGASPYPETPRPLAPWLAALIAALFLVERWLANGPRRRHAQ
jgi:hypothetical protein